MTKLEPAGVGKQDITRTKILDFMVEGAIVELEWLDSKGSYVVWQFKDEYDDDIGTMKTVGYFIKQTENATIICQSISDDQYGKVFRIPTVSILKVREIK